jgi:hypothetical protein
LIRTALAAVGCSAAVPSDDAPGVTPLALAAGWFDRAAVVLCHDLRWLGPGNPLEGSGFGRSNSDWWKLIRLDGGSLTSCS